MEIVHNYSAATRIKTRPFNPVQSYFFSLPLSVFLSILALVIFCTNVIWAQTEKDCNTEKQTNRDRNHATDNDSITSNKTTLFNAIFNWLVHVLDWRVKNIDLHFIECFVWCWWLWWWWEISFQTTTTINIYSFYSIFTFQKLFYKLGVYVQC